MQVIEEFTQSKTGDDSLNEDKIVVTDYFIAVLDGVTSRRGQMLQGMTNGRFAVHTIAAEIARLPRNESMLSTFVYSVRIKRGSSRPAIAVEGAVPASCAPIRR